MSEIPKCSPAPRSTWPRPAAAACRWSASRPQGRAVFLSQGRHPRLHQQRARTSPAIGEFEQAGATVIGCVPRSGEEARPLQGQVDLRVPPRLGRAGGRTEPGAFGSREALRSRIHGHRTGHLPDRRSGVVRRVWRKVSVKGHAAEVLAAVHRSYPGSMTTPRRNPRFIDFRARHRQFSRPGR